MAASNKLMYRLKTLFGVTCGAGIFFVGLNVWNGNEKFYNQFVMPTARYLPAETSHNLAVLACKYKLFPAPLKPDAKNLCTKFFSKNISNPIGIAAGFDKQGEAVEGLQKLGFGFVEIGSVTPEPQPGNPEPRVFRLIQDEAIINRYGFNSEGHKIVFERLNTLRKSGKFNGILGVNLGKNKSSDTPQNDYVKGVEVFGPIADYLVINISSPNTPGLRNLQEKNSLERLIKAILVARNNLTTTEKVPIFVKLSPDLNKNDIVDIVKVLNQDSCQIDGLVVCNTTTARKNLKESLLASESGGLSGVPLRDRSTSLIAEIYHLTQGKIPIIGVGGITTGQDAFEKLEAGATYLQCYTAFIFQGPPVVTRIKSELSEIIKEKGFSNVQEVTGISYKKYLYKDF